MTMGGWIGAVVRGWCLESFGRVLSAIAPSAKADHHVQADLHNKEVCPGSDWQFYGTRTIITDYRITRFLYIWRVLSY